MKKKLIFWGLTILLVGFIFCNSLQDADTSHALSEPLTGVLGGTEFFIRKCAHFSEFAVLGLLLALNVSWGKSVIHTAPIAGLLGLMTACMDETLQLFPAGRSSQLTDVWLDFGGVVCGILLLWLIKKFALRKKSAFFD